MAAPHTHTIIRFFVTLYSATKRSSLGNSIGNNRGNNTGLAGISVLVPTVLFLFLFLLLPARWAAASWDATIRTTQLPSLFMTVDKEKKKFYVYSFQEAPAEKAAPRPEGNGVGGNGASTKPSKSGAKNAAQLNLVREFVCTTGKVAGDKQIKNDLKTPEGIYFVDGHIPSGLDFREYGGSALTLDYPNPVDKLRGKTGNGIWIHSKGYGLEPTRGCVAIGMEDFATLKKTVAVGTPILIGETARIADDDNTVTITALRDRMRSWSTAWEKRSPHFFSFYDGDSYSKTTETFSVFRANKEKVFKSSGAITLTTGQIAVLEGPGYYVTYAKQRYKSDIHTSEGIRILYWIPRGGAYKIVGMRWMPIQKSRK